MGWSGRVLSFEPSRTHASADCWSPAPPLAWSFLQPLLTRRRAIPFPKGARTHANRPRTGCPGSWGLLAYPLRHLNYSGGKLYWPLSGCVSFINSFSEQARKKKHKCCNFHQNTPWLLQTKAGKGNFIFFVCFVHSWNKVRKMQKPSRLFYHALKNHYRIESCQ